MSISSLVTKRTSCIGSLPVWLTSLIRSSSVRGNSGSLQQLPQPVQRNFSSLAIETSPSPRTMESLTAKRPPAGWPKYPAGALAPGDTVFLVNPRGSRNGVGGGGTGPARGLAQEARRKAHFLERGRCPRWSASRAEPSARHSKPHELTLAAAMCETTSLLMSLKIDQDHSRFRKIVRGKIRQNLRRYISQGEMLGRKGKDLVSIPIPQIDIPRFTFGSKDKGGVGQGDGDPGDQIGSD